MNTDHIWVYSTQAQVRVFHRIVSLSDETSDSTAHTGRAMTLCSSQPRYQFATSLEPPEYLDLCDKCALADYEAWVVYTCLDADGAALYVGVTNDMYARMASHRNCKKYSYRWMPLVARIETQVFENCYLAGAAEREAILKLQPRFNTQGRKPLVSA
jgi:predicted GIY-YIG superfamily endonuclease